MKILLNGDVLDSLISRHFIRERREGKKEREREREREVLGGILTLMAASS
jgi:hypothetical protein